MTSKLQNLIDSTHAANFRIRAVFDFYCICRQRKNNEWCANQFLLLAICVTKNTFQFFLINGKNWHAFHRKGLSSRWHIISARNRAAIKHIIYIQPFLQPEPATSVQIPSYKYRFLSPIPMFPKRNQNKITQISRSGWLPLLAFCKEFL